MAETVRPAEPLAIDSHVAEIAAEEAGTQDFEVALVSLNQWQLAWRRYKRHHLAVVGSGFLLAMIGVAIFGTILWPYNPNDIPGVTTPGGDPPTLDPIENLFGTDFGGRSVLQMVIVGARISVAVGPLHDDHRDDDRRHRRRARRVRRRPRGRRPDALRRPDAGDPVPVRDPRRGPLLRRRGSGHPDRSSSACCSGRACPASSGRSTCRSGRPSSCRRRRPSA